MGRAIRHRRRFLWRSLGLAALLLVPYAVRYGLVRYRVARDIDATEREQKEWIARDRAEGEAMKRWMEDVRQDVLRRHGLTSRPSTAQSSDAPPAPFPATTQSDD